MKVYELKIFSLICKQIFISFIFFLSIFSLIIFGNQLFLVFSQSLKAGLYSSEILSLLFLKFARDFQFIFGLSFILSIIFSLNKLYKSSELIVLKNSGFSDKGLFYLLKPIIYVVTVFTFIFSFFVTPSLKNEINIIKQSANLRPEFIFIKEKEFQIFNDDAIVFFSSDVNNDSGLNNQLLNNIFIYNNKENKVILAERGKKTVDNKTGNVSLILYDGEIYNNFSSKKITNLSVTSFKKFEALIFENTRISENPDQKAETKYLYDLEIFSNRDDSIEFFYRLSVPTSFFIMAIFAVLVSEVNPRTKGNFAIGYGLVVYILHYNLVNFLKKISFTTEVNIFVNFIPLILVFLLVFLIYLSKNNFTFKEFLK